MTEVWHPEEPSQGTFDYDVLETGTRAFVLQATREIHGRMRQTAENIVQIGMQLHAVKGRLEHGQFMAWVQGELGMSRQTCQNFMNVARKFADKLPTVGNLPLKVLYELASAPDLIIEQVAEQQLPPTLEAIREAKATLKAAQEAERQARNEAEQQRHTASLWQQELERSRGQAEQQRAVLQQQIEALQEDMKRMAEPQVITNEVVPQAVQKQLDALRHKVETLTGQRDALSKQVEALGAQARAAVLQADEEEMGQEQQVRSVWRTNTATLLQTCSRLLIQWPAPLDAYHFEDEDWRRLSQIEEHIQRLQSVCVRLREVVERTVTVG